MLMLTLEKLKLFKISQINILIQQLHVVFMPCVRHYTGPIRRCRLGHDRFQRALERTTPAFLEKKLVISFENKEEKHDI